jgi:putative heme-binding domain-containing protein
MSNLSRRFHVIGPALLVVTAFLASTEAHAQRAPFSIPDPDPEIERKSFVVADGFEVNLFAADPLIAKPIQMNFDSAGRLWIASSEVYPQIAPGAVADDKVLVLEDSNGDGKADKTTIFARGLLIPTGIEPGDGGAYVANSTELLHFKDTDGDGKADQTRVVLSGFGTEDTHHILHTLRWGHDGMLYFNQSIYIHSHIETPHGVKRLGGGGIWQFRPETMELDVFIRGLVNPWGHHIDRFGQSFATDGAGGEGINYCLPGAYYFTAPDGVRFVKGLNPGSPKHCGLEIAGGSHLPESWRGSLLTNDFRGNRVCRFVVSDDGAGFAAREQPELIKTRHVAFRPIDIKMGPDGAIYIADWYNPIIQHGEVDFRDSRRDHTRGRIWRVTARGRPLIERPKLLTATSKELLDLLESPDDWTRHHARRVLKERGAHAVLEPLAAWTKALDPADGDYEHQRLEALWMYQSLDTPEPRLLDANLNARDPRVRAAAVRVVAAWLNKLPDPLALLASRVVDESPRVRLEAIRALGKIHSLRSADLALSALDLPVDTYLDYALWLTARELAPTWLPELQAGRFDFSGKPARLVFALQAAGAPGIVKPLLALLQQGKVPPERDESVRTLIAALGQPDELGVVLDTVVASPSLSGPRRAGLLSTLVAATRHRKVIPAGDLNRIGILLDNGDEAIRIAAIRAVGFWKTAALEPRLIDLAKATETPEPVRAAAIESLVLAKNPQARAIIDQLTAAGNPPARQAVALAALWELEPKVAAFRTASWLRRLTPEQAEIARIVVDRVVERKGAPELLAHSLAADNAPIAADVAKLAIRQLRDSGRDQPALVSALTKAGRLDAARPKLDVAQMAQLVADVTRIGNPARGESIFRRADMTCLKCHAIAGAGGQVGPSLESIGASAQVDYLIDSLMEPSKNIKENYHAIVAATSDGKVYTGIKLRQTDTDLVLRDANDHEINIALGSIEEQGNAGSLMPTGLTDSLTRAELVDLVSFLSQLGKIGPYSVGTDRVFRSWTVLGRWPVIDSASTQSARELAGVDLDFQPEPSLTWQPVYTTVGGELPLVDLAPKRLKAAAPLALARTRLDVSVPGEIELDFGSVEGLAIWIDGKEVAPSARRPGAIIQKLDRGTHTITVAADLEKRRTGIRCVLADLAESPARAQVVLGK